MITKTIELKSQDIYITEDSLLIAKFLGLKDSVLDCKIRFIVQSANTKVSIVIKSVLLENSRFNFEGILDIQKGAISTESYLKIDCLVVGENASANAIPSLEIHESDVKAGHGATIGYIDPLQINYLGSRGVVEIDAISLLIESFL